MLADTMAEAHVGGGQASLTAALIRDSLTASMPNSWLKTNGFISWMRPAGSAKNQRCGSPQGRKTVSIRLYTGASSRKPDPPPAAYCRQCTASGHFD
ncbi:hypothetical protein KCP74_04205 [Salmonella enterica subsp. enterica]|nr:hypothetical protein KCP74_04205 [Salmonella enterica subsp. enterica]